jgi:hypothetical protein
MIDIAKAMLDPAAVFRSPGDVVRCIDLSWEQQVDILCCWAYNVRDMEIAANDDTLSSPPSSLEQILEALHTLNSQRERRTLRRQSVSPSGVGNSSQERPS